MRFNLDRSLWPEALMAAVATLTVAWPLTNLLEGGDWIGPSILLVILVAVVGSLLRSVDLDPALVVVGQALAVAAALLWRYLSDTLSFVVVPGPETLDRATELLREAGRTLQTFAAPAPTNEGVEFLIVSVLALTAVSVDAIGVTGRAPATAGLPLAAAFLVSVSNSGEAMQPWFFAAAALAWLLMVAQQGNRLVSGWSSADRRESVGAFDVSHGPSGHRTVARVLAAGTVLSALILASVVPHLPPTFFAEGLARNPDGRSVGGSGQVSFTETMDVSADLRNQSNEPVIRFRSASRPLQPLRVTATAGYDGERWLRPDYDPGPPQSQRLTPAEPPEAFLDDTIRVELGQVVVLSNGLRAPHLAVPGPVVGVTADDATMQWDAEHAAVRVDTRPDTYEVDFLQIAPRGEVPAGVGEAEADPDDWAPSYLQVDEASAEAVSALADQVVGDATNDLEVANLLQQHFRSGLYTYSLDLAPDAGAGDPISHFLQTQRGYCVQFATAMVMMARAEGIPARMAVGFLPGELQANGSYAVLASDAHTWPELWIDGLGWTRFEPTPGIRTGPPPAYTELTEGAGEEVPTVTQTPTPTEAPTQEPGTAEEDPGFWQDAKDFLRSAAPILLRALAVVLLLAALMVVVAIAGRRHRESLLRHAATPQERIEGQWELLKRSLEDYGIDPPPDRSPREMASHYVTKARLDRPSADALGRATAVLERARYADASRTQETDDATMHGDIARVLDSVSSKLPWNIRASAKLFPRSGWHYLRSLPGRLLRR